MAAAGIQPYTPIKVPLSRDAYLQEIVVGLEATNAILPSPLFTNPMLPPGGHAHYLQGYTEQPVGSTKGQGVGH